MSRKWTATRELPSSARLQFPGIGHESDVGNFLVCLSRHNSALETPKANIHLLGPKNCAQDLSNVLLELPWGLASCVRDAYWREIFANVVVASDYLPVLQGRSAST
jgi:hypothetical protein